MKKRLLLDGIALHPTNIAPRNIKLATLVVADFADSRLAFCNWTAMSAGEAANAISLDLLVQLAFTDVPITEKTRRRCGERGATCRLAVAEQRVGCHSSTERC